MSVKNEPDRSKWYGPSDQGTFKVHDNMMAIYKYPVDRPDHQITEYRRLSRDITGGDL